MGPADFIGGRGEGLAYQRFVRPRYANGVPFFWLHDLGAKCQTFDYWAELVGAGERTPYFFLQVKTTRKDYTAGRPVPRVRVEVSEADVRRMARLPAPAYLAAVHDVDERVFLVSIHGDMSRAISSVSTAHELTAVTKQDLWDEVRAFWAAQELIRPPSRFTDPELLT